MRCPDCGKDNGVQTDPELAAYLHHYCNSCKTFFKSKATAGVDVWDIIKKRHATGMDGLKHPKDKKLTKAQKNLQHAIDMWLAFVEVNDHEMECQYANAATVLYRESAEFKP